MVKFRKDLTLVGIVACVFRFYLLRRRDEESDGESEGAPASANVSQRFSRVHRLMHSRLMTARNNYDSVDASDVPADTPAGNEWYS